MVQNQKMLIFRCSVFICLAFTAGCSTLLSNQSPPIQVMTSNNQVATAEIKAPIKKPYTITIPSIIHARPSSFEELSITLIDPCFKSFSVDVGKTIHPSYWANIFTYFIGFPLDYFSGYMWKYDKSVHIPLIPNDNLSETCASQYTETQTITSRPLKLNSFKTHRIGAGFLVQPPSRRYSDDETSGGFFLEYNYLLNREFIVSLKYQFSTNNYIIENDCNKSFFQCPDTISTDQKSLSFSLRHYISPETNFYTGLGVARTSVEQNIDYYANVNEKASSNTNASIFLDFGWQARGQASLHINASIDLAELYLTNPGSKSDRHPNNRLSARKASELIKGASLISGISVGFTLGF